MSPRIHRAPAAHWLTLMAFLLSILSPARGQDATASRLKVIASVPTYGALAREIGGDLVDVVVLCRPTQDIHGVTALPSLMATLHRADLLLHTGLDAEPWIPDMLRGSGNTRLLPGRPGAVSLSDGLLLKDVPTEVSRAHGDIHAYGNTHLWTDPNNVRTMATRVRDALVAALPEHEAAISARHRDLHLRLTRALLDWLTRYAGLEGHKIVVYHNSWTYFTDRFGLVTAGTIEPKPRVVPTVSHLENLVQTMQAEDIRVILREPFQHPDATDFVSQRTGAVVLELTTHPGFPEGVDDIIEHFEHNLAAIAAALDVDVPARSGG